MAAMEKPRVVAATDMLLCCGFWVLLMGSHRRDRFGVKKPTLTFTLWLLVSDGRQGSLRKAAVERWTEHLT